MRTTVDLPDDLFREAKSRAALQGQSFKDLVADGLRLLLQSGEGQPRRSAKEVTGVAENSTRVEEAAGSRSSGRKRGSAGAWARKFAGIAKLAPGETTEDARMDHYRKKYGV